MLHLMRVVGAVRSNPNPRAHSDPIPSPNPSAHSDPSPSPNPSAHTDPIPSPNPNPNPNPTQALDGWAQQLLAKLKLWADPYRKVTMALREAITVCDAWAASTLALALAP